MNDMTIGQALADVRIEHKQLETMLDEAIASLADPDLDNRRRMEPGFNLRCVELTVTLVVAMTMAYTLAPAEKFEVMLPPEGFAAGDEDLAQIGERLVELMVAAPRLAEGMVAEEVLQKRAATIVSGL